MADQGLGLAGVGSLRNAQAALYAIPSSSFHSVTSGFNGYSATSGYDLVTGLGTPIANRVVAGLLATQGVYNVTGFSASSPYVHGALRGINLPDSLTWTSTSGTSTATAPGSPGPTSTFPAPFPPNTVIVVPLGPTRVVIIVPTPIISHSPFASNTHPVQPETPSLVGLPVASPEHSQQFRPDRDGGQPVWAYQPVRIGARGCRPDRCRRAVPGTCSW